MSKELLDVIVGCKNSDFYWESKNSRKRQRTSQCPYSNYTE